MGNNLCNCLNKNKNIFEFGKNNEMLFQHIGKNYSDETNLIQVGRYSNRSIQKNTEYSSNLLNESLKNRNYKKFFESINYENFNNYLLIKIQSFIKKFLFKIKWDNSLKLNYVLRNQEIIKRKMEEFKTTEYQRYEMYNPNYSQSLESPKKISKNKYKCKLLNRNFNKYPSIYIGEVDLNYNRNGYGILYTLNNEKYEGYWERNEIKGKGRFTDKNEEYTYEGEFINNIINGKGEKYYDNYMYKGEFLNNKKEGFGEESTEDYNYIGYFSNDLRNGKGKIIYKKTGESYEGDFKNDELTGFGTYKWNNNHIYKGEFLNGNMNGMGYYTWPEGGYYKGNYINNIKEGYGEFMWPDGKIFKGSFNNGKPHGKGILIIKNIEKEVIFNNGQIEGEDN